MKKIYLFVLSFLLTGITLAQTSWVQKQGPLGGDVIDIEYYPGTPNVWILVNYKVYRSTDDGATWSLFNNTLINNNSIYDIEIANNTIYFLAYDALYSSTDQGNTVVTVNNGGFFNAQRIKRLPVSNTLVVLTGSGSPDVYFSTNNGTTWNAGFNTSTFNSAFLAVNKVDQIFMIVYNGSAYRPYRSTDNGGNFTEQSTGIAAGQNVRSLVNDATGDFLYAITDTDIYRSANGTSWTSIKGGQISDASIASASATSFLEFSQDGLGMYFIDNLNHKLSSKGINQAASLWVTQATDFPNVPNGTIWPTQPIRAASAKNYPGGSPTTSTVVFGTTYGIIRTSTGGASNPEANTGLAQMESRGTIATRNGALLMSTYNIGMLRSSNSGDSWTRVTALPQGIDVMTNVVQQTAPKDGMTQLVLANSGVLYRSTDDGQNWASVTTPVTFSDIQGGDNNRAFGVSGNAIYFSGNGGSTFGASQITITGLPGIFTLSNMYVPTTTSRIYLYLYNSGTGTNQYYRVDITYSGAAISTAAATVLPAAPLTTVNRTFGANNKLYIYNSTSDQIAVFSGTSWSALRSVPNGSEIAVPANNGYIFIAENASPSKLHMSKDDGVSFTSTDLPASVNASSVYDVTVSPQDYVFLTVPRNYMYQSKTKVVLPAVPTALTEIARLANAFVLRWTDNASNENSYRILRSSDGGSTYATIGTIEESDICGPTLGGRGYFTDNTVVPGVTYRYKVKAVNEAGEVESTALSVAAIPAAVAQTVPDNRSWSAQNSGTESFPLQTSEIVGIQHLGNGRYKVSDISNNTVTSSAVEQEFYVNGTVTAVAGSSTQSSSYDVRANGTGTWNGTTTLTLKWLQCSSNPTKTETITYTLQANDPAPAAPALQALIRNNSEVELTWSAVFYAKNYIIERSTTGPSSGFTQLGSIVAYPATSVIDAAVTPGTTYYYRMKARNGNVSPLESSYSTVVTLPFQRPNFIVSATTVSNYVSTTVGSYWADFDKDGNEDLMTVNGSLDGASLSTITIFKNLGNGDFEKKNVVLDERSYNFGGVADMNGDGFPDLGLIVSEAAQVDFYKGNGDFTFTKFTPAQLGDLATAIKSERQGISWADVNNDGRLDVVISGEYSALIDDRTLLFIQNANGTFSSVNAGDLSTDVSDVFSTYWSDVDNDGYQDLLLGSSNSQWKLYKNKGDNTFQLIPSGTSGIDASNALAAAFGDINNDGFPDLYVGMVAGAAIYVNDGDGTFTKNTSTSLTEAGFVVSAAFGDINNDGLQDLIVPGYFGDPTRIYVNTSTGSTISFNRIVNEKLNDIRYWHIGVAMSDYDKNGFLDVAMGSLKIVGTGDDSFVGGEYYLYKNNNSTGNWSGVRLAGVSANKNGIGAKITVTAGGKSYTREVYNPTAFTSLGSMVQHFGLGATASITNIQVKWPTNPVITQNYPNPPINTVLTITQDQQGPVITSRLPAIGATNVGTGTNVEVTFDEAALPVAGKKLTIIAVGDANPTANIDVTTGVVTGNKFTFELNPHVLGNKQYNVTIEAGAFTDIYGNPSLAISGWNFTTAVGPQFTTFVPAAGATNVAATTALELTANANITAVAGKKLKVFDVANSAVLDIDVSTTGTVAGTKYTVPAPAGGWPFASVFRVTLDAGAFVDGSQNDTPPIAALQWTFTTVDAPDLVAPEFGILSSLPTSVDKASLQQTFNIPITDNKAVTAASMFAKPNSSGSFVEVAGAPSTGNLWQFAVSASLFDATGVQYYFTARDAANNTVRSPLTGTYNTLVKYTGTQAQVPASLIGTGGTINGWKVIAVPFDLGANNGIQTAFEELTGTAKVDYRLLRYTETPTPAWQDYPAGFSTLERGVGYFINVKTPTTLIVGDNLIAPSNTRENLFKLNLKKGWNMVGNPYLEPIDLANLVTANGLANTSIKKFADGNYVNSSTLAAYEGGFINVAADVQVSVPFLNQTTTSRKEHITFGESEWLLPMTLRQGPAINTFGGIGMHRSASVTFDSFDDINAPRIFDFVEMNFPHQEFHMGAFARDVVPVKDEQDWTFEVMASSDEIASLHWDPADLNIGAAELYLYDETTQTLTDMKTENSYSFDVRVSKKFRVYFGANARNKVRPQKVLLGAAYPNPSSGQVTIPFSLPEIGGRLKVRLDIFDLMGRKVATLADGDFDGGIYKREWQADDGQVTPGLYTYRLVAGDEIQSGKVVLKK